MVDEDRDIPGRDDAYVTRLEELVRDRDYTLARIYNSRAWKTLLLYYRLRDSLLPLNSKSREVAKRAFDWVREGVRKKEQHRRLVVVRGSRASKTTGSMAEPLAGSGCRRFALYVASLGNYFFFEIRDVLGAGLRELGFEVELRTERDGFIEDVDWHVVVAPHEFFYLGVGAGLREESTPPNLILFNTEQPTTEWFALASDCFSKAHCIWDIHYDSARLIVEKGFPCYYLSLGYSSRPEVFPEVCELPENYGTCFLEPEIRRGAYLNEPLARRPIDVLFIGTITSRRDAFFAAAAPVLSNYRCYLSLPDASSPKIAGANSHMDTATATGLAQRSKIVLNIHRGRDTYFEWHRVVMHGIWQKALVLSEPCSQAPPLRAGIDFVEAELDAIPEKIDYYLSTAQGQMEAQRIATQGFQTLTTKCKLTEVLWPLILKLYVPESPNRFWQAVTSGNELYRDELSS